MEVVGGIFTGIVITVTVVGAIVLVRWARDEYITGPVRELRSADRLRAEQIQAVAAQVQRKGDQAERRWRDVSDRIDRVCDRIDKLETKTHATAYRYPVYPERALIRQQLKDSAELAAEAEI